jgi:hypothetical protein
MTESVVDFENARAATDANCEPKILLLRPKFWAYPSHPNFTLTIWLVRRECWTSTGTSLGMFQPRSCKSLCKLPGVLFNLLPVYQYSMELLFGCS